jgi:hypothetical protein
MTILYNVDIDITSSIIIVDHAILVVGWHAVEFIFAFFYFLIKKTLQLGETICLGRHKIFQFIEDVE